jgi:hypothetical protein
MEEVSDLTQLELRTIESEGLLNLQRGNYSKAEELFRRQLHQLFLLQEKYQKRFHKGGPFHNLGLSFLFQGNYQEAIKNIVFAYIEDLINSVYSFEEVTKVDIAPASNVLRGILGFTWDDLKPFEKIVMKYKIEGIIILDPNELLPKIKDDIQYAINNYESYLRETWEFEIEGQKALKEADYNKSIQIYTKWYIAFLNYQEKRDIRIHKGTPLFNIGFSYTKKSNLVEGLNYFFYAQIENIISARKPEHAKETNSFKILTKNYNVTIELLNELQEFIL